MLGITARRLAITLALALVPTTAFAAKTGADVWQGKIGKVATVQIVRNSTQPKQASAYVSYTCEIAGAKQTFTVTTSGPVKHDKIKFSGSTDDGLGTAKISAKL